MIQKLIFLVMDKNCLPNKYFNLNFKVNVFEQKKINYKKKFLTFVRRRLFYTIHGLKGSFSDPHIKNKIIQVLSHILMGIKY